MQLFYKFYIKFIKNFSLRKILYLTLIILFSPLLIFIVLIKPIILIRFGSLGCERIGRFLDQEHYLLLNKFKKRKVKSFDIWVIGNFLCNKQLLIIYKRKFLIIQHLFIFYKVLELISKYIHIYSQHIIMFDYYYDIKNLMDKYPTQLNLTRQEINRGELTLKQFGIPNNAKIVCIMGRDNLYLKKSESSTNYSYHNYRNSNIDNFIPAIKALIKKNFYVVRMGNVAAKRVNLKNDKFIDYSFHPLKSDFMDFFFAYKCYFWVGSDSGLNNIPKIFRKPVAMVNTVPISTINMYRKEQIVSSKIHINSKNQKLNVSKIFDYGVAHALRNNIFNEKKIKLKELNSEQIKDVVLEMLMLIKNSWKIKNKKDLKLQEQFKKIFLKKIKEFNFSRHLSYTVDGDTIALSVSDLRGVLKSNYSINFLKKNRWFLK